jgi:pimeloyl-ACP methyl ester carboxylesterase
MLTRIVRISLALELAAWIALGSWLHREHGWGVPAVVLGAGAGTLAIRLALVCFTSIFSWVFRSERSPAQRLGVVGTLRLVLGEWRAMVADNFWYLPFDALAVRPDPPLARGGPVPILLVHGYMSSRGYWAAFVRWLEARGVQGVHVPNFTSVFSSIERLADELHAQIERIATGTGHERVVLVCHSMGGLAARLYLRERGDKRVARLVTLASPHHGTALAVLGVGEHGRQMRRGSAFLGALADAEAARPPQVPTLSIYSMHDNLVAPQETSRLPWARNVAVAGLGHVDLIASGRVYPQLLEEIRAARAG